jgi:hypothetical protein
VKVEFKPVTPAAITYIAANMRQSDRDELNAMLPLASEMEAAWFSLHSPGVSYVCWVDDNPVFAFGVAIDFKSPHRGGAWGFGTDDTPKAIRQITKFIRRKFIPELIEAGVKRVEVRVLDQHTSSLQWISTALKARYETPLYQAGFDGETFIQYSWTRDLF